MKCDTCRRTIEKGEPVFTAVGVYICKECDTKKNGTISMDDVFDKIVREEKNSPNYCPFESRTCVFASNKHPSFECKAPSDDEMTCKRR